MLESVVEKALREAVEAAGGLCWKNLPDNKRGIPDRTVMIPGGVICYVETKRPGKSLTKIQAKRARQIVALGTPCIKIDNITDARNAVEVVRRAYAEVHGGAAYVGFDL